MKLVNRKKKIIDKWIRKPDVECEVGETQSLNKTGSHFKSVRLSLLEKFESAPI